MLQQPCTPRPRPPTFTRTRSSNRRTTAERRIASQADAEGPSSSASLLADAPAAPDSSDLADAGSKHRTVSAPVDPASVLPSLDERLFASSNPLSQSASSSGSTVASPPPPPYPSLLHDQALVARPADGDGTDPKDLLAIDIDKIQSTIPAGAPVTEEWIKERSREELDMLLLEADRVIREREKELGIAAAIGKSLLENNIALRKRHESLLQAVPETQPESPSDRSARPSAAHAPSSWVTDDGAPDQVVRSRSASRNSNVTPAATTFPPDVQQRAPGGSGSFLSDSSAFNSPVKSKRVSLLAINSPTSSAFGSHSKGHSRRAPSLTASPQALAYLRDQNHELAAQLEMLQAETSQADHSGRKQLRKLEKEIGGLRAELEKMETMVESLQEKNGELETQFVRAISPSVGRTPRDGGWAERRKLRREEEWEMKAEDPSGGGRDKRIAFPRTPAARDESPEVDPAALSDLFTPSSSRGSGHLARSASSTSSSSPPASPRTRSISLLGPVLSESRSSTVRHSASPSVQRSNAEMEVVAQLLSKIRELEQANIEIRRKRDELDAKLSRAIQEGAELEGVYNALEDEVERAGLDVDSDDDDDENEVEHQMLSMARVAAARSTPSSAAEAQPALSRSPESAAEEGEFFSTSPSRTTRLPSPSAAGQRSPFPRKETFIGQQAADSPTPSTSSTVSRATGNRLMIQAQRESDQPKPPSSPLKRPLFPSSLHRRNRSSISYKVGSPARSVDSSAAGTPDRVRSRTAPDSLGQMPAERSLDDELKSIGGLELNTSPSRFRPVARRGRTPKRSSLHLSSSNPLGFGSQAEVLEALADAESSDEGQVRESDLPPRRASGRHVVLRSSKRKSSSDKAADGQVSLRRAPQGLNLHVMPPIVAPGSLFTTPPAECPSFDTIDTAVADRPMRWAEDELFGRGSLVQHAPPVPKSIWSFFPSLLPRQRGDPFEIDFYRETFPLNDERDAIARLHFREARVRSAIEAGEDPWSEENLRAPTRRELALLRLGLEAADDGSGGSDDDFQLVDGERRGHRLLSAPTDGPLLWSERMKPGWVVDRVSKSWMRSAMEVVFCVQVLIVGLLFLSEVFSTRKKKMRTIERGPSRH